MTITTGPVLPSSNEHNSKKKKAHEIKDPVIKGLIYRAFGNDLIEQARNIVNLHKIPDGARDASSIDKKNPLNSKDREHIKFSYLTMTDIYRTGSIEKFMELSTDLFSVYTMQEISSVLGLAAACHIVIRQGQYFVEQITSDPSYMDKLRLVINTLTNYVDVMSQDYDFIFYYLFLKTHYLLNKGKYQEVLDGLHYHTDDSFFGALDMDQKIIVTDLQLTALDALHKYDEALTLIQENFSSFPLGNYIMDHPDLVKKFTNRQEVLLKAKGSYLAKHGQYKSAEKLLSQSLQKNPNDVEVKETLSRMHLAVLSRTIKPGASLEDRLLDGKILFNLGKYDEAKNVFQKLHDAIHREFKQSGDKYNLGTVLDVLAPLLNDVEDYLDKIDAISSEKIEESTLK